MKVILLQDVAKIGRRGDIAEVPHGFALNKLIPQKLAEEATAENLKRRAGREGKIQADREAADAAFLVAVEGIAGKEVVVPVGANESGHMFEALKPDRITAVLKESGIELSPSHLRISTPIKHVGVYDITAVSGSEERAFSIRVVAE